MSKSAQSSQPSMRRTPRGDHRLVVEQRRRRTRASPAIAGARSRWSRTFSGDRGIVTVVAARGSRPGGPATTRRPPILRRPARRPRSATLPALPSRLCRTCSRTHRPSRPTWTRPEPTSTGSASAASKARSRRTRWRRSAAAPSNKPPPSSTTASATSTPAAPTSGSGTCSTRATSTTTSSSDRWRSR